ncbi:invasin domain 3-containing protein, partial [Xenorhabdus beddingii]|uniref:invasin domain 3-containing protein n=1 Tax=Xenorhabdus beddingii TaxID=40578 RepID=UPI00244B1267
MIDTDKTGFKPENSTLGKPGDSTEIILTLKDKDGNPITGAADKITLTDDKSELYGPPPYPTLGGVREDPAGSGIYKAKVTAGEKKGNWTITPIVDGKELKPTTVTFGKALTEIVDTKGSQFTPATNILAADNEDSTILTLHLKDKDGKPIPNAKDSITFEDNGATLAGDGKNPPTIDKVWEEPENSGIYKVKVKAGDKTGQWKIITKIEGRPLDTPTDITFGSSRAGLVDPNKSEFIPDNGKLPNAGDTTVIKLTLKDINGHPITGAENSINLIPNNDGLYGKDGTMPTYGKAKEVPPGSGLYEVPVTAGSKKGQWTLTPEVFGKKLKNAATIDFGQTLAEILSTDSPAVEPEDGSNALAADGKSTKTLRVKLNDKRGKPITGAKDSIKVTAAGQLKGDGKDPQIGEVQEIGDGVYEVVVTAGLKTGDWTLTTAVEGTDNKQETVIEFDENKAPAVSNLQLNGTLHVGKTLTATYQFAAKDGNTTDRSIYAWGEKGRTAERVEALAKEAGVKEPLELEQKNGEGRVASGESGTVKYTIQGSDIGKVLEVSVLAANDANLRAKTPVTVDITDPNANKGLVGGNGKGGVADPQANPLVKIVELTGELTLPTTLTASYQFDPNGGDNRDKSRTAWTVAGESPTDTDWKEIANPSQGSKNGQASVTLAKEDASKIAGKVIVVSILPVNGAGHKNPDGIDSVSTAPGDPRNKFSGGGQDKDGKPTGTIVDPDAKPIVSNLILAGSLVAGETLTASYAFDANNGDPKDYSEYSWYRVGYESEDKHDVPDESKATRITGGVVTKSGEIAPYTLTQEDINHYIEIRLQPKMQNGKTAGELLTVNSNQGPNIGNGNSDLTGGSDGHGRVIDPSKGPKISDLKLVLTDGSDGKGKELGATYRFESDNGDIEDKTLYLWGAFTLNEAITTESQLDKAGHTVAKDQKIHSQPHKVPPFPLTAEHAGKIIALSIQGQNGKLKPGNLLNATTKGFVSAVGANPDGTVKGIADAFTVNVDKTKAKAKIDLVENKPEPITLTIKTQKDGKPIGGVPVTLNLSAVNRQNKTETPTAKLEAQKGNGVLSLAQAGKYTGHTNENGELIIKVTDPDGKGVKTTLKVTAEGASGS